DDDVAVLHGAVIGRIVEHGGVEAGADDGRVSRALTAAPAELILHQRRDFAFVDARMDGLQRRQVRRDRSVRSAAKHLQLTGIFYRTQAGDKRPGITKSNVVRKRVAATQPFHRPGRRRGLPVGTEIGKNDGAGLWQYLEQLVVHFVEA